jgi:hypothetical protein
MATRFTVRSVRRTFAAVALTAIAAAVSGCLPRADAEHVCACVCYKEVGTAVYMLNQSVSTTKDCGNVNGSACSGEINGQHIDGQFANCGPNPNVAGPRPEVPGPQGAVPAAHP